MLLKILQIGQLSIKKLFKRIAELLKDISRSPYEGKGKPELLKHNLQGCWSRRITDEHRLIYRIISGKEILKSLAVKDTIADFRNHFLHAALNAGQITLHHFCLRKETHLAITISVAKIFTALAIPFLFL